MLAQRKLQVRNLIPIGFTFQFGFWTEALPEMDSRSVVSESRTLVFELRQKKSELWKNDLYHKLGACLAACLSHVWFQDWFVLEMKSVSALDGLNGDNEQKFNKNGCANCSRKQTFWHNRPIHFWKYWNFQIMTQFDIFICCCFYVIYSKFWSAYLIVYLNDLINGSYWLGHKTTFTFVFHDFWTPGSRSTF